MLHYHYAPEHAPLHSKSSCKNKAHESGDAINMHPLSLGRGGGSFAQTEKILLECILQTIKEAVFKEWNWMQDSNKIATVATSYNNSDLQISLRRSSADFLIPEVLNQDNKFSLQFTLFWTISEAVATILDMDEVCTYVEFVPTFSSNIFFRELKGSYSWVSHFLSPNVTKQKYSTQLTYFAILITIKNISVIAEKIDIKLWIDQVEN